MSISKKVPLSNVEFQGMSLSQVSPHHLLPVLITPNNIKAVEPDLLKIIPALLSQSLNSSIFNTLDHFHSSPDLIISLTQHLKCHCGELSNTLLNCSHYTCSKCLKQPNCPFCKNPISPYQQNSVTYPCMSCKERKPLRTNCVHYCLNCIVYKLSIKDSFNCFICCESFSKTAFSHLLSICSVCNTKGPFSFELTCGHFFCKDCLIKPSKTKTCPICQTKIPPKQAYKLQKNFKYRCHSCLTFKSQSKFTITACCSTKLCLSCTQKSPIRDCCNPLN